VAGPVRRLLLVVNPSSGQGRGLRWLARVRRLLAAEPVELEVLVTQRAGEARERVARGVAGLDGVWGIGGDGTLHELLGGLAGGDVPLSVLPAGTGNVVARELGIPRSFAGAFALAWAGAPRRVDLGLLNGAPFLFVVSAGFDAAVVHDVASRRRGTMRLWHYVPAVWRCRRAEEPRLRVIADGEVLGGAAWVAVLNSSRYAGGFRLCPGARMDDGALDLLLLRDPVGPRALAVVRRALAGRFTEIPDALRRTVREVRLEGVAVAQVDGDPGPAGDLHVAVAPASLPVRLASGRVFPDPDADRDPR